MRRRLRQQLVALAVSLGLAVLAGAAINQWLSEAASQRGVDLENARRSITYELKRGGEWIRFPLPPGLESIKLTSNAIFPARAIMDLERPLAAEYVLEYLLIKRSSGEGETRPLHETATLPLGEYRVISPDLDWVPAPGQTLQFDLSAGEPAQAVWFRLAEADPLIDNVSIRVNALEAVADRDADIRWHRLTRQQQARLFRGSLYPPELARREERTAVSRTRWVPLGPEGIQSREYNVRLLYLQNELEEEDGDEDEILAAPAGLRIGPAANGVVPVPPEPGLVQIDVEGLTAMPGLESVVALEWNARGLSSPRYFRMNVTNGRGTFRERLGDGTLVVISPIELVLTASTTNLNGEVFDITPKPAVVGLWRIPPGSWLEWEILHEPGLPATVRMDLRPIAPGKPFMDPSRVLLEGLDATGSVVWKHDREIVHRAELFERPLDDEFTVGAPLRLFLSLPQSVVTLRARAVGDVVAAAYVRPASMPYRIRVPVDYYSYSVDPPRPALWYGLDPVDREALLRARQRVLLQTTTAPSTSDADTLAGQYEFTTLSPEQMVLGRELLLPRPGSGLVRDTGRAVWYRPLQTTQQLVFRSSVPSEQFSPDLLWFSGDEDPGKAVIELGGQVVTSNLVGRQGSIALPRMRSSETDVTVKIPSGVSGLINFTGRSSIGVNRLRRFALGIGENSRFIIPFEKQAGKASITFSLYQPSSNEAPVTLKVSVISPPARETVVTDFTAYTRHFLVSPRLDRPPVLVLGSDHLLGAAEPFFFPMGEDMPLGKYRLEVSVTDSAPGYLSVYTIIPGETRQSRFSLDSPDELERITPDE